jgi:hypothetical protein
MVKMRHKTGKRLKKRGLRLKVMVKMGQKPGNSPYHRYYDGQDRTKTVS